MILAADIGGTKALFAVFTWSEDGFEEVFRKKYQSNAFDSLEDVVETFFEDGKNNFSAEKLDVAVFALAGPVFTDSCYLVNLDWMVKKQKLYKRFPQINEIVLCNDLVATGASIALLPKKDFVRLSPSLAEEAVPMALQEKLKCAILAPGTGLGEAFMLEGKIYPSEGAHAEFGPASPEQVEIRNYFARMYGHVSYERILSGAGLSQLERYFRNKIGKAEDETLLKGEEVTSLAARGLSESAALALNEYVQMLAAEAGNLVLRYLAVDGIYLAGGIPSKIIEHLQQECFMYAFYQKGRFTDLMKKVPVYVVTNASAALYGAAYLAFQTLEGDSKCNAYVLHESHNRILVERQH